MKIEKLYLKNFLSHEENEIVFDNGITMIVGYNGAGKSSIIDAFRFALFGEKRGTRKEDRIEDMIKKGKHDAVVSLEFRSGLDRYVVTRRISQKKSENYAILERDGLKIADTVTGVNQEIEGIIGISRDVFMNSIFVRQGEIDSLVSEDASKRKDTFSKLLGLDRISKTSDILKDIIRRLEAERSGYADAETQLNAEVVRYESYQSEIKETSSELEKLRKSREALDTDLNLRLKELNEARILLTRFDVAKSRRADIENSIARDEKEIESLRKREAEMLPLIQRLNQIESDQMYSKRELIRQYIQLRTKLSYLEQNHSFALDQVKSIEAIRKRFSTLEPQYKAFREAEALKVKIQTQLEESEKNHNRFLSITSTLDSTTNRIDRNVRIQKDLEVSIARMLPAFVIPRSYEELNTIRDKIRSDIESYGIELQKGKSDVNNIEKHLSELNEKHSMIRGQNKCPVCGSDLDEKHSLSLEEEYSTAISNDQNQIRELQSRIKALDLRIASLTEMRKSLSTSDLDKIVSTWEEIKRDNDSLASLKVEEGVLRILDEEYQKLKADLVAVEKRLNDMTPIRDQYISLESTIRTLESGKYQEKLDSLTHELENLTTPVSELADKIGFTPNQETVNRLDELEDEIRQASEIRNDYISLKSKISTIENRINDNRNELSGINISIRGMGNPASVVLELENELERVNRLREESIADISRLSSRIISLQKLSAEANERITKLTERNLYFGKIGMALLTLSKIRDAFDRDGIQAAIRHDSAAIITDRTRTYLSSFGLNIEDARVDEDFNIMLSQNGMEQSISSLSGGERTAVAIAVRLAIAGYLTQKISTMILDEPTAFLDEDRRKNLKDIIQYSLRNENIVPQMIIISHHSDMNTVADVTYEVKMISGKSVVETI